MKSKQLANVLIKILGLSALIHSIPNIFARLYELARLYEELGVNGHGFVEIRDCLYAASSLVMPAIGMYLIIRSRKVTELLIKNEDE